MEIAALFSPTVLTSAGGIVIAIILIKVNGKTVERLTGNHINHHTQALDKHTETLSDLAKNVALNSEALRTLTGTVGTFRDLVEHKLK